MMDHAERALVGLVMRRPECLQSAIMAGLLPHHFDDAECREVWIEILRAELEGRPFDAMSLRPVMPRSFSPVLIEIEDQAPFAVNASFFIDEILAVRWRHELAVRAQQVHSAAVSAAPFSATDPLKEMVLSLGEMVTDATKRKTSFTAKELWKTTEDLIEDRIKIAASGGRIGVSTGYPRLDECIHGLVGGRLLVVGARPKVGKTTFALNLAYNAAQAGTPVAYFTYEMGAAELGIKAVSLATGVSTKDLHLGDATDADLMRVLRFTAMDGDTLPLFVEEPLDRTFERLMYRARQRIRTSQAKVLVVDYVGLLNVTSKSFVHQRPLEVAHMTGALKQLAREENVCVVAVAQINRKGAETEAPELHHLRESGSYEQDADHVILLWRDEYGNFCVSVAANRHGSVGDLILQAKLEISRITDPEKARLD